MNIVQNPAALFCQFQGNTVYRNRGDLRRCGNSHGDIKNDQESGRQHWSHAENFTE